MRSFSWPNAGSSFREEDTVIREESLPLYANVNGLKLLRVGNKKSAARRSALLRACGWWPLARLTSKDNLANAVDRRQDARARTYTINPRRKYAAA